MKRKIISISLIAMLLFGVCLVATACVDSPDNYTVEQHIERIAQRVEKKYINDETRKSSYSFITGYKIYPLYNANDKVEYFLVEFEPYGFLFVTFNRNMGLIANKGMYFRNDSYVLHKWYRYRLSLDKLDTDFAQGIQWQTYIDFYGEYTSGLPADYHGGKDWYNEVYDTGELVGHNRSPYMMANMLDEKLYVIDVYTGLVPAVKRNGIFINLVSMQEFEPICDINYYKNLGVEYVKNNIPHLTATFHYHVYL